MKAPFPWFGGKSRVASMVWQRFGDVANYVEPFFGSGAVLLGRPGWSPEASWTETVNDRDGFVCNFWRAVQHDPARVAHYADSPVNENDLHARHVWLRERRETLTQRLEGDPDFHDPKIAGWWVWGVCVWIGGGWCGPAGAGPWQIVEDEAGARQLVHLAGRGVTRQRVHLGNAGTGVTRRAGHDKSGLVDWMETLAARLARVRVASGDWSRVMSESVLMRHGLTGVFLDPPYSSESGRDPELYGHDDLAVAHDVRDWCLKNGENPLLRIALCGYDVEHSELSAAGWTRFQWSAGGYAHRVHAKTNRHRETIWFSPQCVAPAQLRLFE